MNELENIGVIEYKHKIKGVLSGGAHDFMIFLKNGVTFLH